MQCAQFENEKRNRYGVCEWYLAAPGPGAIEAAAKMGFTGIQIADLGGPQLNFPLTDPRIQQQYREASLKYQVKIQGFQSAAGLTQQGGIRYPFDSPEGRAAVFNFKKGLEVCEALEIPTYMAASFQASRFQNEYELKNTAEMLKLFVSLAGEKGIRIAYESFCPTDKLLRILDYAGPELRLCYDTLNPIRFGNADPAEEIRRIGIDRIDHVHLKDAYENMVGCCPLGKGAGRIHKTLETLRVLGYRGWYFAENYFYLPPMNQLGPGWDLAVDDLKFMQIYC